MITIKNTVFLFLSFLFFTSAHSQKTEKDSRIKNLIESKNYVFKAQSVNPVRGSTRQLSSDYDLQLFNDSLVTYLPYFGRAYSAPINATDGGIKLNTTHFNYTIQKKKRGGWELYFTPTESLDISSLHLSVSASGYASLQVQSTNRDPISFNGYVTDLKKNK